MTTHALGLPMPVGKPRTVCGLTMAECIGDYVATSLAAVAEAA